MAKTKKDARREELAESAATLIAKILGFKDDASLFKDCLKKEIANALSRETIVISCTDSIVLKAANKAKVNIRPKQFAMVISTSDGIGILLSMNGGEFKKVSM